jgi:hypothetical protein
MESFVTLVDGCDSRPNKGACREGDESGLHSDNAFVCSFSREEREAIAVILECKECPLNE